MKTKKNILFVMCIIYLVITGIISLIAYIKLPDKMNTQFSFKGEAVNSMPKLLYLAITIVLVIFLSLLSIKGEKEQKIKYFVANTIVVIANIAMIVVQL